MATKILVVDDSPTIGKTVGWLLSNSGYAVRTEQTGLGALNAIRTFHPDLIVLDVRLEHFDGVELCKIIRRFPRFAEKPIIMLSALTSDEDVERALTAGADDYIKKPLIDDDFLSVIHKQLQKPTATAK
jgi:DNA-binding response OmpR family regulator